MNEYEAVGLKFLAKIDYLAKKKGLKTQDSVLSVLDRITLRKGFHIGLKLAAEEGMGDESAFYCYGDVPKEFIESEFERRVSPYASSAQLFRGLSVEPTAMGAWQAYLLLVSETLRPVFWHGGYIVRTYFFDREYYNGILPLHGEPVDIPIEKIPQPTVELKPKKAIIRCPYWNDWGGLMLESFTIKFLDDGKITVGSHPSKVLYKYQSMLCF